MARKVYIHRFHDDVAINLGAGTTVYMTQAEAQRVVTALNEIITEIATRSYYGSPVVVREIPVANNTVITHPWVGAK